MFNSLISKVFENIGLRCSTPNLAPRIALISRKIGRVIIVDSDSDIIRNKRIPIAPEATTAVRSAEIPLVT
ncbi:hypothetical protein D3C71_2111370 [compost metagenome]